MVRTVASEPGTARQEAGPAAVPRSRPAARHARSPMLTAAPAGRPPARASRPAVPQVLIAGAHGGAGASTLAALLRLEFGGAPPGRRPQVGEMPAVPDADPARIVAAGRLPVLPPGTALIVAARGTAHGARRAVIAVTALELAGIRPVAVAVIADGAGPEPRQAAQRFTLIDGRAGPLIRVPFAAALRAGASPAGTRLPRRFLSAVNALAALAAAGPGRQP